jgi:hypothetical protein
MPISYNTATAELAMTLSTLAYVDENRTATQQQMIGEINAGLDEAGYPSWRVVWGPALNADRSNLLYAARNSQTGQLAVSIRGSDFSFWLNWIEDLAVLRVVPYKEFVPTASNTAQIAFGTAVGLRQILRAQDGTESLETFLTAVPEGTPILITGHSLGGCLASVLAPCVAYWRGSASSLAVYTIAAPSPGNADFATYYNTLFTDPSGHSTAFRFFNSLDVVPNAWATLATVMTYYPPLVRCPLSLRCRQDRCPSGNGSGRGVLSAWPGRGGQRSRADRHHRHALGRAPKPSGAQSLRECAVSVGGCPAACLHDVSDAVTDAIDPPGSRQAQARARGVRRKQGCTAAIKNRVIG